jgi:hypothetical protein
MADCKVQMTDDRGGQGILTIKDGGHLDIGSNTTLNCKNGNIKVTETKPTTKGVVKHPVLVIGPGLRLKKSR